MERVEFYTQQYCDLDGSLGFGSGRLYTTKVPPSAYFLWWVLALKRFCLIFVLVVVFTVFFYGCKENEKPFVEEEVINQLRSGESVHVTIQLRSSIEKDTGILGIIDRKERLNIMEEYYRTLRAEVLADLDENDFRGTGSSKFGPAFYGNITQSGLEKLAADPRVLSIHLIRKTHITQLTKCDYNYTYSSMEECTCDGMWRPHPIDSYPPCKGSGSVYFCRQIANGQISGEVIVGFKQGILASDVKNFLEQKGIRVIYYKCPFENSSTPYVFVESVPGEENKVIAQLKNETLVEYVETHSTTYGP